MAISIVSCSEFSKRLVERHCAGAVVGSARSIPALVGAGISATCGVALDEKLRQNISRKLGSSRVLSYEEIYAKVAELNSQELSQKIKLRKLFAEGGIPLSSDRPAPNISNLALIHLTRSGLLGPVISLNIDPLLNIASEYHEEANADAVRFVTNLTQVSDFIDTPDDRPTVLQVHGSIEEPLSLRFLPKELVQRDPTLAKAVDTACANSSTLFCIGTSMNDKVALHAIERWAQTNKTESSRLEVFAAFFEACPRKSIEPIVAKIEKLRNGCKVEFIVCEGAAADLLFQDIVEAAAQETLRRRAFEDTTIFVPLMPRNSLRAYLGTYVNKKTLTAKVAARPDELQALKIELILHAVAARGPFTVRDLTRTSNLFRTAGLSPLQSAQEQIGEAMRSLVKDGLLVYLDRRNGHWVAGSEPPVLRTADEIETAWVARSPAFSTAKDYAKACLHALRPIDGGLRDQISEDIARHFLDLERDAGSRFVPAQSAPTLAQFGNTKLITNQRQLDAHMDKLKETFKQIVWQGRDAQAYVVTETGEHLFRPELLKEALPDVLKDADKLDEQRRNVLRDYLRDWLLPLFDSHSLKQTLHLYVATRHDDSDHPINWLFTDNRDHFSTRRLIEKNTGDLIALLGHHPNFTVSYVPWESHTEHMWYYIARNRDLEKDDACGIYYPTRFYERLYFGVEVSGAENIKILESMRYRIQGIHAFPAAVLPTSYVLACTFIPTNEGLENLEGRQVLVCVRSDDVNNDHKSVASIPTMRIGRGLYETLLERTEWLFNGPDEKLRNPKSLSDPRIFVSNNGRNGDDPLCDAVNHLLARKFNLGDALERGEFVYSATPGVVRIGKSPVLSSGDSGENLAMINVLVQVHKGHELLDSVQATAAYSHIKFIPISEFESAVANSSPIQFDTDSFTYGGLCVCTASLLLHLRTTASPELQAGATGG